MIEVPDPVIRRHDGILVVRDDLVEGGSKMRFLPQVVAGASEIVYGAPFCGGAPWALSVYGRRAGVRVTLFYARRDRARWHGRQRAAEANGATIVEVPYGYMTNVQAKARAYAESSGAVFLPLGFDVADARAPFVESMSRVRARVGDPDQVWCASGSGMLARCLGVAFPESEIRAVAVGLRSRWSAQTFPPNVSVVECPLPFERQTRDLAPFSSCGNYDRKAWAACVRDGMGRRLFWNVAGE